MDMTVILIFHLPGDPVTGGYGVDDIRVQQHAAAVRHPGGRRHQVHGV